MENRTYTYDGTSFETNEFDPSQNWRLLIQKPIAQYDWLSYNPAVFRPMSVKAYMKQGENFSLPEREWKELAVPESFNPHVLIGFGRNGTSLAAGVFSHHPEVMYLYEPRLLVERVYPELAFMRHKSLPHGGDYQRALDDYTRSGDLRRLFYLVYQEVAPNYLKNQHPKPTMFLKINEPSFLPEVYLRSFPKAKLIWILRHPVPFLKSVSSFVKKVANHSESDIVGFTPYWRPFYEDLTAMFNYDFESKAEELKGLDHYAISWVVQSLLHERFFDGLNENQRETTLMVMSYEAFVANPKASICKMSSFLELSQDEVFLEKASSTVLPKREDYGTRIELEHIDVSKLVNFYDRLCQKFDLQ